MTTPYWITTAEYNRHFPNHLHPCLLLLFFLYVDPTCALPNVIDDHLLMSMKSDSSGQPTLEFGCRPIGRYILNANSSLLTCIDGMWNGPIPECTKLLDEQEIDSRCTPSISCLIFNRVANVDR